MGAGRVHFCYSSGSDHSQSQFTSEDDKKSLTRELMTFLQRPC